ncbi:MAG TPA: response regulator, partial [Anaeromyxobacteraceae bacterium]|nr:response regulator [Anaeromyxobacteraceae bacterium]
SLLVAVLLLALGANRSRRPSSTEGELGRDRRRTGEAHDLDDLLLVIQSGTQLARESLPPGHPAHAELADVAAAAARGQALARQLLAFSRKQPEVPSRADAAAVLRDLAMDERPTRRTRVLLAGQDPALIALVSRLLAARGHDVLTAASALETRQQAASFPGEIDVVVAGLVTGKDSGIAVLGEARRTSPSARAVIVSADADTMDVEHVLDAGVELVRRPVQPEALVEVVERAAARSPVRRATAMA